MRTTDCETSLSITLYMVMWPSSWYSPVEMWWHTVTHGRGSEGETGERSG